MFDTTASYTEDLVKVKYSKSKPISFKKFSNMSTSYMKNDLLMHSYSH